MQLEKRIYESKYLHILFEPENDLFVQFWKESPKSISVFKKEMLEYTSLYSKFKPVNTLWLQANLTLNLDNKTFHWIEEKVNVPCKSYGNEKCAFVISKDVLAHMSTIDTFDKVKSCIVVKHFLTEYDAREWLMSETDLVREEEKIGVTYHGIDGEGNLLIKISNSKGKIKSVFSSLQKMVTQDHFVHTHFNKFNSLTRREKQVLNYVIKGMKHKDICEKMNISLHTVRTHWRNVKAKLNIKHINEIGKYAGFYS